MSKHQIPKRIRNNANHIFSSIMVLQTNTMTLGILVIKCPLKPREDLHRSFNKNLFMSSEACKIGQSDSIILPNPDNAGWNLTTIGILLFCWVFFLSESSWQGRLSLLFALAFKNWESTNSRLKPLAIFFQTPHLNHKFFLRLFSSNVCSIRVNERVYVYVGKKHASLENSLYSKCLSVWDSQLYFSRMARSIIQILTCIRWFAIQYRHDRTFAINFSFDWDSAGVIYFILCRTCGKIYVGSTITYF